MCADINYQLLSLTCSELPVLSLQPLYGGGLQRGVVGPGIPRVPQLHHLSPEHTDTKSVHSPTKIITEPSITVLCYAHFNRLFSVSWLLTDSLVVSNSRRPLSSSSARAEHLSVLEEYLEVAVDSLSSREVSSRWRV